MLLKHVTSGSTRQLRKSVRLLYVVSSPWACGCAACGQEVAALGLWIHRNNGGLLAAQSNSA